LKYKNYKFMRLIIVFFIFFSFLACKNNAEEIPPSIYGIGPYEKLTLNPINDSIMKIGMETFKQNAVHAILWNIKIVVPT